MYKFTRVHVYKCTVLLVITLFALLLLVQRLQSMLIYYK